MSSGERAARLGSAWARVDVRMSDGAEKAEGKVDRALPGGNGHPARDARLPDAGYNGYPAREAMATQRAMRGSSGSDSSMRMTELRAVSSRDPESRSAPRCCPRKPAETSTAEPRVSGRCRFLDVWPATTRSIRGC